MSSNYKKLKLTGYEEGKGLLKIWRNIKCWWFDINRHSWYRRNVIYRWNNFEYGIKNLIRWFPIVWKDRDWDHHYILEVLKFKIKNTRDLILKNDHINDEDLERINKYCSLCIKLMVLIQEEKYLLEYQDYEVETTIFGKKIKEDQIERLDEYLNKYRKSFKEVVKTIILKEKDYHLLESKSYLAHAIGDLQHQKAKRILFLILQEQMEFWWD